MKVCMYGFFIFGSLIALSTFGWNYFGLKIKQQEKKEATSKKIDTIPQLMYTYQIHGDYVKGDKVVHKSEKPINAPNALIVTQNQKGGKT